MIAAHDPEAQLPRRVSRKLFYKQLANEGRYDGFLTWKAAASAQVRVYFDEEPAFDEDNPAVKHAMTALGLTPPDFFAAALSPPA